MNLSSTIIIMGGAQLSASSVSESLHYLSQYDGEVILVHSQEHQRQVAEIVQKFSSIRLIEIPDWNSSVAAFKAMTQASGEVLHFLGAGAVVTLEALSALKLELMSHPSIGMVGPIGNTSGWQSASYFLGPQSDCRLDAFEDVPLVQSKFSQRYAQQSRKVKSIEFCGLTVTKSMLMALGGFDQQLNEDIAPLDLAWRMGLMDKEIRVVQSAFVYFPSWNNRLNRPYDSNLQEDKQASERILSGKLLEHYGDVSRIPSSWDLWEVEHFQFQMPTQQSLIPQESTASLNPPVVVVYATSQQMNLETEVQFTLDGLQTLGASTDDILFVDGSSSSHQIDLNSQGIVSWSLNDLMGWSALLPRLQAWFPSRDILVLQAGTSLKPSSWRFVVSQIQLQEKSVYSGPMISELGTSMHQAPSEVFDWTDKLGQTSVRNFIFQKDLSILAMAEMNLIWTPELEFTLTDVKDPLKEAESSEAQSPEETSQDMLQGAEYPGYWKADQYLDSSGQPIADRKPDMVLLEIDSMDMPALSVVLRFIKHPGLKQIFFKFSNNYVQQAEGPHPYAQTGISPYDLRREVELAGFGHLEWDGSEFIEPKDLSQHEEIEVNIGLRTRFETLCSIATEMTLSAKPLSEQLHTDIKISLVVLALNKIEYTAKCIESAQKYCQQNIEWVLVNNGSTDGTMDYFRQVPGAIVIDNPTNLGVSAGWNQGIRAATGDYVMILNNDVILAPGSIENLVRCAINHPQSGIVAPRTNNIAGPQKIEGFDYVADDRVPGQLIEIMEANALASWQFPMIKGFCMLMPREVIQKVGYFDEAFGFGNFEDDDYSQRVARAGYELRVANDSVIFHYGSASFGQANIDWDQQMIKNQEIYNTKWSRGRSSIQYFEPGYEVPEDIVEHHPQYKVQDLESSMPQPELDESALLNEENLLTSQLQGDPSDANIYRQLAHIRHKLQDNPGAFKFYCQALGMNSFLDAIDYEVMEFLEKSFSVSERMSVIQYLAGLYPHLKAFQEVKESNIELNDSWVSKVQQFIESENYQEALATLNMVKEPSDSRWYNFRGLIAWYHGILDEAYDLFKQGLQLEPTHEDMLLNIFDCSLKLRLTQDVEILFERALSLDSNLHEARKCLEVLKNAKARGEVIPERLIESRELNLALENQIREGLLDLAMQSALDIIKADSEDYRAWNNKGLIHWYQEDMVEAIACFVKSVKLNPWYTDAVLNHYDCALLTGQVEGFEPVLNQCLKLAPNNQELLDVRKELLLGQWPERLSRYQGVQEELSQEKEKLKQAQDLIQNQKYDEAVVLLTDLLQGGKELSEAYNSLGIISYYWGNYDDAWHLVNRSLSLSPLAVDTLVNLWDIAQVSYKQNEAVEILTSALEMDPSLSEIRTILEGVGL